MAVSGAREVAPATPRLWLTELVGSSLVDAAGERQGDVVDAVVRLGNGGYPPVTGLLARVGGHRVFVPRGRLSEVTADNVALGGGTEALTPFERRQGEVLLRHDVLDRRMISVETGRVINANDIELALLRGTWRVVGVDAASRRFLSRLVPRTLRSRTHESNAFVDWSSVEPFTRHVPTSRLLMPVRRLRRLHPAQIADIVEQVSHDEGEEIIDAVHADPELEADVFEELNTEHQVEFLRQRSDEEAAAVLAGMGPDDAADLITELDQERRMDVLSRLPAAQQAKVRALLSYNPESAGGLMAPDFVAVPDSATVSETLEAVRKSTASAQQSADVFVTGDEGRLIGAVDLVNLVRARPDTSVKQLVERGDTALEPGDDLPEVARLMTDFNLTVAPVVDEARRVIGVISVDDVLEAMLPDSWRRRSEADSD